MFLLLCDKCASGGLVIQKGSEVNGTAKEENYVRHGIKLQKEKNKRKKGKEKNKIVLKKQNKIALLGEES